jgi:alpha-tubulin suppressor-like RCC1 family protein
VTKSLVRALPNTHNLLATYQSPEIKGNTITQYDSLNAYREDDGHTLGKFEDFEQIAANQTTFTALSRTGQVWTWGDGRYESCLGREVYDER